MKKSYIIGIVIVIIVSVGSGIALVVDETPSDSDILSQISQDSANGESDRPLLGGSSEASNQPEGDIVEARTSELRSITTALPDIDVLGYNGQNTLYLASTRTGNIFSSILYKEGDNQNVASLFSTDTPQIKIATLPEQNLDYIFLTTERQMERFVIFKKGGKFFRYDVVNDTTKQLPQDIGYAIIEPRSNQLYYITTTTPTEIRSLNIDTNQVRTHITRSGIRWFDLTVGNIVYRTNTELYRYDMQARVDRLIQEAIESVSASVSPYLGRALIEVDGKNVIYDLENDTIQPVSGDWNTRQFVWQRNSLQGHTINSSQYSILDLTGEASIQQFSVQRESLNDLDQQHMFVTGDGTLMFLDKESLSLIMYPSIDRNPVPEISDSIGL